MRHVSIIVCAALAAASPALACTGQSVQLAGDFQIGEKGWGDADAQFQPKAAEAVLTPQPGTQTARWNSGATLGDLDACLTVAMPEKTVDPARSYAGLLFWVTDKDNFYEAVISPNGMFTVARKLSGSILPAAPVAWTQARALKQGANEKNVLRITLQGQTAVLRINDTEVARFRGQAPEQPSHVGLVAASAPGSAPDTWRMTDFKVTDVAAPAQAANGTAPQSAASETTGAVPTSPECAAGKVLFEDSFKQHDAAWGPKDSQLTFSDGEAVLDPAPGTPMLRWNRAFVFGDIDACARVQLAKETGDPTASYAGLAFWVKDSRNYYEAVIAPNGYFTVARIVDGKAEEKRPVEWTKLASVNTGAKQKNTLRVTAKGADVQVTVNGKSVASFKGDPPPAPSYIGLLAASAASKKGDTWSISDLKVAAPQ
jgi:hypothetical protein